jgi:hypothetical protein
MTAQPATDFFAQKPSVACDAFGPPPIAAARPAMLEQAAPRWGSQRSGTNSSPAFVHSTIGGASRQRRQAGRWWSPAAVLWQSDGIGFRSPIRGIIGR